MSALVFWIIIIFFIYSIFKKSKSEEESETKEYWQEIQTKKRGGSGVKFNPVEVKTGSALADMIPLWEAAGRGKYEIVEEKLAAGSDVNEPDTFFGETALHRAAKAGDLKMVQMLLGHGARVDTENQYGETPLHFAVRGRNPEVVKALLKHGADPDFKDRFGRTPAHCASFYADLRDCFV